MKLFVYGTLQRGYGNNYRLAGATFLGKAVTQKPYVLFNGGFPYAVPVSVVEEFPLLPVMGELYEVEQHHIDSCDRLEGHPSWYHRKTIQVTVKGGLVDTFIYEMPSLSPDRYRLCNTKDNMYYWA